MQYTFFISRMGAYMSMLSDFSIYVVCVAIEDVDDEIAMFVVIQVFEIVVTGLVVIKVVEDDVDVDKDGYLVVADDDRCRVICNSPLRMEVAI